MAVNKAALDLICEAEGFVDHWYPDPAHGWDVPTCCYGHTDAAGEPKYRDTKHKRFAPAEGRAILLRDLEQYEAVVRKAIRVATNENQIGALVSFTYNLGPSNFLQSTLLKKLNAGDYDGAAAEFGRWTRAKGKVLQGLVKRRAAEAALFAKPDDSKPVTLPTPEPRKGGWLILALVSAAALIATGFGWVAGLIERMF